VHTATTGGKEKYRSKNRENIGAKERPHHLIGVRAY